MNTADGANLRCRSCGSELPKNSIQGDQWPRACAGCYDKENPPLVWSDAVEIAVTVRGRWFRVWPHISNDGLLAMRVLPKTCSYVLLTGDVVRMRPDDFVMPAYLPESVKTQIEQSFIVPESEALEAKAIFEAFESNDFEVIDS